MDDKQQIPKKRSNLQLGLLVVTAVALLGSFTIYRSFADAAPIDASHPTTVLLKKTIVSTSSDGQASANYTLKTSSGLSYCMWGTHSGNASITAKVTVNKVVKSKTQQLSGPSSGTTSLICFTGSDNNSTELKIDVKGVVSIGSIVVS